MKETVIHLRTTAVGGLTGKHSMVPSVGPGPLPQFPHLQNRTRTPPVMRGLAGVTCVDVI